MKIFKIPVSWTVVSTIEVEAATLAEALLIFNEKEKNIQLDNLDSEYLPDSFQIDGDALMEINK